jgi:hypothetical protein
MPDTHKLPNSDIPSLVVLSFVIPLGVILSAAVLQAERRISCGYRRVLGDSARDPSLGCSIRDDAFRKGPGSKTALD